MADAELVRVLRENSLKSVVLLLTYTPTATTTD